MLRFSSINQALQYLSDYTGDRVFIAGYDDQKPSIIEKLKKHKSNIKDDEIESILESIQKCDPVSSKTKGKKSPFTEQITNWYINNKIRLPEDENTVKDTLQQYSKFKGKIKKKVDKFNSPGDLRKELEQYIDSPDEKSYDDLAEVVASEGGYKMYEINDFDTQGRMCFKDSGWCVQQEGMFSEYEPPYYMITKGSKRYALLHHDSYQLKDVNDNPLTLEQAKPISKLIMQVFPENPYKFEEDEEEIENDLLALKDLYPITDQIRLKEVERNPSIVKEMDNFDEKTQIQAIKQNWKVINYIKNPSDAVQLEAVKKNWRLLKSFDNPSEAVQLAAVKRDTDAIKYVDKITEEMQIRVMKSSAFGIEKLVEAGITPTESILWEGIKSHEGALRFILEEGIKLSPTLQMKVVQPNINRAIGLRNINNAIGMMMSAGLNPSDEVVLESLKHYGLGLKFIIEQGYKPTEEMKIEAVKNSPYVISDIKNPSEAIQIEAVKKNWRLLKSLKNPSEAVQLAAVKSDRRAIEYIDNPSEAVKEMAKRKAASVNQFKEKEMLRFASEEEALQHLADLTGKRIKVANQKSDDYEEVENGCWLYEEDFKDSKDYEAESKDEDDELEISFKFDYRPEERMTRNHPGSPEDVEVFEVRNATDDKEINISDLTLTGMSRLEDSAFEKVSELIEDTRDY
jgi:hypothetical protein